MVLKLSDEIENKLAELGDKNDWTAWEIGDVTEFIFQHCSVNGSLINPQTEESITPGAIYSCVAQHTKKSPQAIRDYRYTSRHVSASLRRDYHMLGRHHWKALVPHYDTVGDARKLVQIVLSWSDDYNGELISVAALRHRLSGDNGETPTWTKRYKRARKLLRLLAEDDKCPYYLRQAAEAFRRASVPLP